MHTYIEIVLQDEAEMHDMLHSNDSTPLFQGFQGSNTTCMLSEYVQRRSSFIHLMQDAWIVGYLGGEFS